MEEWKSARYQTLDMLFLDNPGNMADLTYDVAKCSILGSDISIASSEDVSIASSEVSLILEVVYDVFIKRELAAMKPST